jgi:hypothetical protein
MKREKLSTKERILRWIALVMLIVGITSFSRGQTTPTNVETNFASGNDLLNVCGNKTLLAEDTVSIAVMKSFENGACLGYLRGVADTAEIWKLTDLRGTTGQQLKDVIVKYLNEHPESRHYSPAYLTLKAVSAAFPPPK